MRWSPLKSRNDREGPKSQRPEESPYKQQSMGAWEPVYTPKTSSIILSTLGIILIAFGTFWMITNSKVKEIRLDYTRCHEINSYDTLETMPNKNVWKQPKTASAEPFLDRWKRSNETLTFDGITKNYTLCTIEFYLPDHMQPPVLFYYRLTNFFQNHRNYGTSKNDGQLKGKSVSLKSIKDSGCKDLDAIKVNGEEKIVYPCGIIAASYFNDTFSTPLLLGSGTDSFGNGIAYNMSKEGIASSNDKSFYKKTNYAIPSVAGEDNTTIVPPPSWTERYPKGYHDGNMFNPEVDESFMVWMRTASSPRFAKLAMRNDDAPMKEGMYRLEILSHFPVHKNGGTKSVIISTKSTGGARNPFLGVANIATGSACILLASLFALSAIWKPRQLIHHIYLHGAH